jgi:hypothetical protein
MDIHILLALDTDRMFPSMHTLPECNSFCEQSGDVFIAMPDGIYRIGGDTDDGKAIHTGIIWSRTDMGVPNKKRVRSAIVTGQVSRATIMAQTESGSAVYPVSRNKVFFGRNLAGRSWDIRVADFERLESFELIPTLLER